jgi:hypothetical protein
MVVLFLTFSLLATVVGTWLTHFVSLDLEDVAPFLSWPSAVLRGGYEERVCFSFLHTLMGDRRPVFVKVGVQVLKPYSCCTTYGFSRVGRVAQTTLQPVSAHYYPIAGAYWGSD